MIFYNKLNYKIIFKIKYIRKKFILNNLILLK